ncbi:tellurite resistance TerB family protein [Vibrio atypicus]|uniref:tellurite resistance TerB family protein n=1 Tax=Vibrio atypicus TaxID=558271 RepID=UPI00135A5FBB|nr:TerB family tellurite resistance protein [Vibrio atypicus]
MLNSITKLFKQLLEGNDLGNHSATDPNLAIACLLCEVAGADHQVGEEEKEAKLRLLSKLLNLEPNNAQALLARANTSSQESASLYDFTSQLRELDQETRFALIEAMWEVANADGKIDPLEDAVIRKAAELLYVDHSEFIRAKLSATGPKS